MIGIRIDIRNQEVVVTPSVILFCAKQENLSIILKISRLLRIC